MSLLLESIKLKDGVFSNLFYHEQRMKKSLHTLCGVDESVNLEEFMKKIAAPQEGLYKCRILFDENQRDVEFLPYSIRPIRSLKVVSADGIVYDHKYADRSDIDELMTQKGECDDVLMIRDGLVTDTSYCNILFRRKKTWYTPWSPLLHGTMRQYLIDTNIIIPESISIDDVRSFEKFKLINSMLGFDGPEVDITQIIF